MTTTDSMASFNGPLVCTTVTLGSGAALSSYEETTHQSTWKSKIWSENASTEGESTILTHNIRKIGKIVFLHIPNFSQFPGSQPLTDAIRLTTPLPVSYRPIVEMTFILLVQSNFLQVVGGAVIGTTGAITLSAGVPFGVFSSAGAGGTNADIVVSYITA